jgi:DNA-binding MarR family transcriptional regulator
MANENPIHIASDFTERYPDASPSATEAAMNIVRTADLLVRRIADLIQPFGLSPSSGLALGILADAGVALPPNQIADRLIISRATVTGLVDSLEKRGYVRRLPHSSDRRMLLIELTDAGRQVAHEFRQLVHQRENEWLAGFNQQEQEQLIALLHRLQSTLSDSKP